jgi:hypothetical protein
MRPLLAPLACLLLLAAWGRPAGAATKKERQRICAKRGFTHASSKVARVFEVDRDGDRSLYGCMRSNGRLQLLSRWYEVQDDVGEVVARGGTFAYADGRVVLVRRRIATVVDAAGGTDLALGRARLYWMRAGLPRSAPLQ